MDDGLVWWANSIASTKLVDRSAKMRPGRFLFPLPCEEVVSKSGITKKGMPSFAEEPVIEHTDNVGMGSGLQKLNSR